LGTATNDETSTKTNQSELAVASHDFNMALQRGAEGMMVEWKKSRRQFVIQIISSRLEWGVVGWRGLKLVFPIAGNENHRFTQHTALQQHIREASLNIRAHKSNE
jgi:hypothetical protein